MTNQSLPKTLTGIVGFDDITNGGLPLGRPTLICGSAGSGKTLFAMTFLVSGATASNEHGVFMSFEEPSSDLAANVASLGYDLPQLISDGKLYIDHVRIDPTEIVETGEYDLEGLFVRLGHAIDTIGAKRVVLDTIEALFSGFSDTTLLRAEFRRLFEWLKARNVTVVITGERGDGQLTRFGIEEYVSDCVILLDNRVLDQVATRRLRIVKYRGSAHGTNEYPFLIDENGISVLPVTSARLNHGTSSEIVSSGVPQLDAMFERHGYYRTSSILMSGLAGTGKSTFAAMFADACCRAGNRCLFFAFEESPDQIVRNMQSVGLDLAQHIDTDQLRFEASRPTLYGLEMHLAKMHRDVLEFDPSVVIIDPISAFRGPASEVHSALLRLVDLLKSRGITALYTSLSTADSSMSEVERSISSLMDTWISLSHTEANGERNRLLYVLKSRGMGHSNQLREYQILDSGISIIPAYIGAAGVLTGSARAAQEASERAEALRASQQIERQARELERKRHDTERQIAELRASLAAEESESEAITAQLMQQQETTETDRLAMATRRG
ncbi:circadian clock protein KaiC [Massilia sp. UYP11]|uniref:circadian clock protein KaiC n=1 Tax=Massilia sp. UYP11 TaxID=1756385 RepID=UPI003D236128